MLWLIVHRQRIDEIGISSRLPSLERLLRRLKRTLRSIFTIEHSHKSSPHLQSPFFLHDQPAERSHRVLTGRRKKSQAHGTKGKAFHRLSMWRWSFSGVRELRDNFKPRFAFQQWNRGKSWNKKAKKGTYLIELDVRNPLVVSISHKKWRAETPRGLDFVSSKIQLKSDIFNPLAEWFIYWGWWPRFSES